MAESAITSTPPKSRRWLRLFGIAVGCLLLLLVVAYFTLTSAAFLKSVILPRVGAALHARVTITDATIRPFSQVIVRGLKVETTGAEPLVTAAEARARYSLRDIIGGRLNIAEVALLSPTVTVVRQADGSSNLDPITQGAPAKPAGGKEKPSPPPAPQKGAAPQIDLQHCLLTNATVRLITQHAGGGRDRTEVSGIHFTLDNLKNGQTGKMALDAAISLDQQPPAPGKPATLQANLRGRFDVALGADLSLSALKGGFQLQVPQASGALAQANGFSLTLDTDLGADPNQQNAVLRALDVKGALRDTPMLLAHLSRPLTVSWGGASGAAAADASLDVIVTNVVLADWRAFAADLDPVGRAHATLQLTSQQSGKRLGLAVAAHLDDLGVRLGTNRLSGLGISLSASGQGTELKQFEVPDYRLAIARQQDTLASARGSISADLQKKTADVAAHLEAQLNRLLDLMPQPGMNLRSGTVQLNTKVQQRDTVLTVGGDLALRALTGNLGERGFTNLAADARYDVGMPSQNHFDLRQCQLALAPTARAALNAVELSGNMNLADPKAIEGALKLSADTLDLTPYYDLFAGSPSAPAAKPAKPAPPAPAPAPPGQGPETEPPAVQLPVKLVTLDVNLARCYLREMTLTGVKATARVEGSHVRIKPCELAVNGGPAQADIDLNLGVPGYEYSLNLGADKVPLEPIANSFSPDYRGRAKGDLLANINLNGKGVTGKSLQSNLAGGLSLSFTNAEVELVGKRAKTLLGPVASALGLGELLKSPLHGFGTDASIASGKLDLKQLQLISPAFSAATMGEIPLASKLSDSPIRNWGVNFALSRPLADKLNLSPKTPAPTEGPAPGSNYVMLANFVKVGGTLGEPKTQTDKMALLQMGAKVLTELPGGLGKEASKIVGQADSLLGGKLTGSTNAPAPSTNASPAGKLLDLFKPKPKNK